MSKLGRRDWLKNLSIAGTGAITLHPKEILSLIDQGNIHQSPSNGLVRLSSNENPYSPSPAMQEVISNFGAELCRYPNMFFSELEAQIAAREGVSPENVVVTSGSREGLKAVGMIKSLEGGQIVTCLPTYKALLTFAEYLGATIKALPLDEDMLFDLEAIESSIDESTNMAFVCNPNNPTGTLLDGNYLKEWCKRVSKKTTVFVDEIYYDYIEEENYPSMKELVLEGHDIIVARTLSKIYGLAGIRIGFMMAPIETASAIRQSLQSGPNIMAIRLGQTALADQEFYDFSLNKNKEGKKMIYEVLEHLDMKYLKSHTNFVFFQTGEDVSMIQKRYEEHGILVGRAFPPFMDWCRISTGTLEEVKLFVEATKKVFA